MGCKLCHRFHQNWILHENSPSYPKFDLDLDKTWAARIMKMSNSNTCPKMGCSPDYLLRVPLAWPLGFAKGIYIFIHQSIYMCVCMCVYVYIYIYVCIYIYAYIYMFTIVYIFQHMYICLCTYTYVCWIYIHKRKYHMNIRTHTHIYICIFIYIYIMSLLM